jgi:hypothetical protein
MAADSDTRRKEDVHRICVAGDRNNVGHAQKIKAVLGDSAVKSTVGAWIKRVKTWRKGHGETGIHCDTRTECMFFSLMAQTKWDGRELCGKPMHCDHEIGQYFRRLK